MPPIDSPAPPREKAITMEALFLVVLVVRLTAHYALPQPLHGDALANFTIARGLAGGLWPLGDGAPHALGYPLVMAPFFALFGSSMPVAFAVNLGLALVSAWLVQQVARQLGLRDNGQKMALLGYALWLPGIWDCTLVVRENLGTPLMLLSAWLALRLLREGPRMGLALAAGATWGAGMLTDPSLLPLIAGPALALMLCARGWRMPMAAMALATGAALMLAPWSGLSGTLPAMPVSASLAILAAGSGTAAPMPAIDAPTLDTTLGRLAMFWWPHVPQIGDHALSRAMVYMRLGEVVQYGMIFTLGFTGLLAASTVRRQRAVIGALIAGFWILGGSGMLGEAWRDPVMPLLIVLTAAVLSEMIYRRPARRIVMRPLTR